jgi:8-oxo-dGTP pyrophosphatase MutT (NUDIX family)
MQEHPSSHQQSSTGQVTSGANPDNLRVVNRRIASAVIFSSDNLMLLGRKDPKGGGVYPNSWHLPGGGTDDNESLDTALIREIKEEIGLDISSFDRVPVPFTGHGEAAKTLPSGERIWAIMEFNRFEVRLSQTAAELTGAVQPGDDLIELRWFSAEELAALNDPSGINDWFVEAGYLKGQSK